MTTAELKITSNYIQALASQPDANERISLFLNGLFASISQKDNFDTQENRQKSVSALLVFSRKEIEKMPKEFRKLFKVNKIRAHVRKTKDNVYEIRCQVNLNTIQASSKNLETAKEKFIAKLQEIDLSSAPIKPTSILLVDYMKTWLETSKKPFIKESTYKDYIQTYTAYIEPNFRRKRLIDIKHLELQEYLTKFSNEGKNRTAKKIYQLLSAMFDYAVADEIINVSPMTKVKLTRYEQESGVPLTKEEESTLIDKILAEPTIYNQAFAFILYTGIRRSELASVSVDDKFVYLTTSKQRKGLKEKARTVPISPMLQKILHIINIEEIIKISPGVLTNRFRLLCKGHHLHDLRHTFITRAQECGIKREYVSLWAGHKADSSITSNVYTHLEQNKEIQIQEMEKFDYKL